MKLKKILIFPVLALPLFFTSVGQNKESIKVLASTEQHDVFMNDVINVESRALEYDGQRQVVKGQIVTPSGNTFEGHSFVIEEPGLYKVIYKTYFGYHEEVQEINYLCKRKSADFFDITNPVAISYGDYRHNTNKYHHEGVLIDAKNGTEIKFNMPLSVEDFLTEQHIEEGKGYKDRSNGADAKPLIDFLIDPSKLMEADFDVLTIRLTDSVDKSNYVDIHIDDAFYQPDPRSGACSYVRVGASCNWGMGWSWTEKEGKINQGEYKVGISGTGLSLSFRGQPYEDNPLNSAQILYCSKNQRFYNYRGSLEVNTTYFINDLADPISYGKNVWNGFDSGKFFVSIIPSSFTNSTGRLLIKSVGKYVLDSEILTDNKAPEIEVDTLGYDIYDLPKAVIGKSYPVFKSKVFDNYDSNLDVNVSVTYKDLINNKNIDVSIKDDKFFVNKSGSYTIKYEAKDRSGNVADVISLQVLTVDSVNPISLQLAVTEKSVDSYSEVTLPSISDVVATGGSGNILLERKLYDPKGNPIKLEGNTFKPTLVGNYILKFIGKDYIGNTKELVFILHSLALTSPVFIDDINLPPVLINGFKYSFSNIRAVETVNGVNQIITPSIKVNGAAYSGSVTANGSSLTVQYIATGKTETSSVSKTLEVVSPKDSLNKIDQAKYFYGDLEATENVDNVLLSTNSDGQTIFATPLNSDDFYVGMRIVSGYNKAEFIKFKFIDVLDQKVSVTFKLDLVNKTIEAPYLNPLSYSLYGNQFGLYYSDKTLSFKDTNQNDLSTLYKDDNGSEFSGFKKGFYLAICLENVSGNAKYQVEKISNQVMGHDNSYDDSIKPTIKYNSSLPSEQFKGKDFVYPTFEAFDVLSDIVSTSIEVRLNGRVLVSGDKNCVETFKIQSSGYYSIIYIARDSSDNQLRITNSVAVYDDTLPTLSASDLSSNTYKVGDALAIPSYSASDDSGAYKVDVILILPTNEMRLLLHHEHDEYRAEKDVFTYMLDVDRHIYNSSFIIDKNTFKLEMAGTYRLRFVAYDSAFNSVTVEKTFIAN